MNTSTTKDYENFLLQYPAYGSTSHLDALRENEFSRLDDHKHVYVDFVGANLYPDLLVHQHAEFLTANTYGNPHSSNPTSKLATHHVETARQAVKDYFNDIADEYAVIFTANASGALKLVGESYPFDTNSCLLMVADNHNSVNGLREFARSKGAPFIYAPIHEETMQVKAEELRDNLASNITGNKLFAYPAQSNFSGIKHDLSWIEKAQASGWDVLLDAAAFVPGNVLDLSIHKPEFVSISFYKMFGYPTGIGCLLAKRSALRKMNRPWFAGGTIEVASVRGDGHYLADNEAGFEDGTVNFLGIPAVANGLLFLKNIGIDSIQSRTRALTDWTLKQLLAMHHSTGKPLCHLYGTSDINHRGATITVNILDENGDWVFYEDVEQDANSLGISLRSGCFCNPGADETANSIASEMLRPIFESGNKITYAQFVEMARGRFVVGAVRVSFGYISNVADAYAIVSFFKRYIK